MLSILNGRNTRGAVTLRLAGQVKAEWVEELRRACEDVIHRPDGGVLVLDLAEVSYIDSHGLALFRELIAHNVILTNCSLFASEQLKEIANANR